MITPTYSPTATERVLPRMALDFTTGVLDPRVTVTRALNTATCVNSSGFVELINANLPRFDYNPITLAPKGLLIEEQRANLIRYSGNIGVGTPWQTSQVTSRTSNFATSPAGTTTANQFVENTSNDRHIVYQGVSLPSTGVYTFSMFLKQGTGRYLQLQLSPTPATSYGVIVDLQDGIITDTRVGASATNTSSSIANYGNGWYRVSVTCQCVAGLVYPIIAGSNSAIPTYNTNNNPTYTGTSQSWLIWGANFEAGAFPTSYIPTVAASLTRNADAVSMTGTNFSDWYNATEGTIIFDFIATPTAGSASLWFPNASGAPTIADNDGGNNARVSLRGVAYVDTGGTATTAGVQYKTGFGYKQGSYASSTNANTVQTSANATAPTAPTNVTFGSSTGANYLNSHIRAIRYYSMRLLNAEIQAFTK